VSTTEAAMPLHEVHTHVDRPEQFLPFLQTRQALWVLLAGVPALYANGIPDLRVRIAVWGLLVFLAAGFGWVQYDGKSLLYWSWAVLRYVLFPRRLDVRAAGPGAALEDTHVGVLSVNGPLARMADGQVAVLLRLVNVPNLALETTDRQWQFMLSTRAWLGSIDFPFQVLFRTVPKNMARYAAVTEAQLAYPRTGATPALRAIAADHLAYLEGLHLLERHVYVSFAAPDTTTATRRLAAVQTGLGRCNLLAEALEGEALTRELRQSWRGEGA